MLKRNKRTNNKKTKGVFLPINFKTSRNKNWININGKLWSRKISWTLAWTLLKNISQRLQYEKLRPKKQSSIAKNFLENIKKQAQASQLILYYVGKHNSTF